MIVVEGVEVVLEEHLADGLVQRRLPVMGLFEQPPDGCGDAVGLRPGERNSGAGFRGQDQERQKDRKRTHNFTRLYSWIDGLHSHPPPGHLPVISAAGARGAHPEGRGRKLKIQSSRETPSSKAHAWDA